MAHSSAREYPWSRLDSDNLTGLEELTEKTLLAATKHRYSANLIYTDVGDILVAVNPFRELSIYDEVWSTAYSCPDVTSLSPHIYRVGAKAFNAMVQGKKDQVCVISGESGAGKTESAKFIMYQVMKMCRSTGLGRELQEKITQLNPILEAFGNASTALNDNSSRFGKYIQLIFDSDGRVLGAGLEQYLLEKSRVCVQGEMERNFHIFYYLFAGLPQEKIKSLQLKSPEEHRYLKNHPGVLKDCTSEASKVAFESVMKSMLSVGFEEEEVVSIVSILAGVLLIGNIEFRGSDGGDDNARVRNRLEAKGAAQALELESVGELCFALTTLRTETRGEKVDKKYTCTKAADVRDALAKALYARLFQWIVSRLNGHLQPIASQDQLNIGILDIFGFENLDRKNSFEQFCINLANEQLQCYFNHQIFAMEKMELEKEGIDTLEIRFTDNKPVLDLYLTRPIGLLSLLDEQCRGFNGTERAFVLRCKESFGSHANYLPHKGNALLFTIKHYAGDVKYVAEGFLEKNKDTLPDTLVDSVKTSSMTLMRMLFRRTSSGSTLRRSILRKNQRSMIRRMSGRKSLKSKGGGQKKLLTVGAHFRQSLDLLMERVFSASPHFVRCIKPNQEKKALKCDDAFMLKQLRYTGMLEAVRVRREGFAYRPYFSDFFNSYRGLAFYYTDQKGKGTVGACSEILNKVGLSGWRIGHSRVFLRYYHAEKLQLMVKDLNDSAILIQKTVRGYLGRKWTAHIRKTQKNEKLYLRDFMAQINKHGKDFLPLLIELNKVDILSSKERFGHLSRKPTVSSFTSSGNFEGLSARDKNLRKAEAIGVKQIIFPKFTVPPPPSQPAPKKRPESLQTADLSLESSVQLPNRRLQSKRYFRRDIGKEQEFSASFVAGTDVERQRALAEVAIRPQSPRNDISRRETFAERHNAFAEMQASLHRKKVPPKVAARSRSQSYGDRQRVNPQASAAKEQSSRDLVESYSRSPPVASNSSVVVAQPGASKLTMVGQNVFVMSIEEGDGAAASVAQKKPASQPAKSTGRSFFRSRNKSKVSAQYEALVQQTASPKPEKKTSRFNFKFPGFGRGRVKELKAQMEQTATTTPAAEGTLKKPPPPTKPKRTPPSVKPKTYFPPPRERAPPPPQEPAPPPPTESKTSPYHKTTAKSPYPQGARNSKTPPYHNKKPMNVSPDHKVVKEQGETKNGSPQQIGASESGVREPSKPRLQKNHHYEELPGSPPSKQPSPTAKKTYGSKYRPRNTKVTPSEIAAVNSSMSLYECEDYLVPVTRSQQPTDSITGSSCNEDEFLLSPKTDPPRPGSLPMNLQSSPASKKNITTVGSTLSLNSIKEEKEEEAASPSTGQPPPMESIVKVDLSLSSTKIDSPEDDDEIYTFNRLEPLESTTATYQSSSLTAMAKPAVAGSSVSLDSVLQSSPSKTYVPAEITSPSNNREGEPLLKSLGAVTPQSSLADTALSSMSLDSILEEFSKMSSMQTGETPQKSLFSNDGETNWEGARSSGGNSQRTQVTRKESKNKESTTQKEERSEEKEKKEKEMKDAERKVDLVEMIEERKEVERGDKNEMEETEVKETDKEAVKRKQDEKPEEREEQKEMKKVEQTREERKKEHKVEVIKEIQVKKEPPRQNPAVPPIPKPRQYRPRLQSQLPRERWNSESELTSSVPANMSQNLVRMKVLGKSEGNLVDEVSTVDLRKSSLSAAKRKTSNPSNNSSGRSSPADQHTMATVLERKHRQKRTSSKNRFAIRRKSSSSESDDNELTKTPSVSSLHNVDWDVILLGFYPHLNHHTVHEFISGQPRGTYAIYKGNLSDEPLSGNSNFGLAVSLGRRGIKQFSIVSSTQEDGQVSYQLAKFPEDDSDSHDSHDGQDKNDNENLSFFELQTLIDYYKFSELSPGLLLRQPRLLAGVYVVGLMKASVTYKKPHPPQTPAAKKTHPTPPSKVPPPSVLSVPFSGNGALPVASGAGKYSSSNKNVARTRKRRDYEVVS